VSEEPGIHEIVAAYTPECMVGRGEDIETAPVKPSREHETAPLKGGNGKVV
jgi:hypothetical protein